MDTISYRTEFPNAQEVQRDWVLIDATDQHLGRLCSKVAKLLRGKYKPGFTPNLDCGDNVIIVNADKVVMTADKFNTREYLRYTGYPGGQRSYTPADLMAKFKLKTIKPGKHPLFIKVVKGMLPKGPLGARLLNNMYVYNSAEHPFQDVDAKVIDINKLK